MHIEKVVVFIKSLRPFLWVGPFVMFFFGYLITFFCFHTKDISTPNFVGKSVQYAIQKSSDLGLNIRLLREKIDPDIKEGIILEQIPRPVHTIKPNQYVFLTISKHPKGILTPSVLGDNQKSISDYCRKLGIRSKIFWLQSHYPKNFCVAQFPQHMQILDSRPLISYISSGNNKLVVFPNLKNKPVVVVRDFLENEGVKVEVFHNHSVDVNHACDDCVVVAQEPMAGSIVDRSKKFYVQLQVSS
jgi:beta-lactam-binding protein with PASTA domain